MRTKTILVLLITMVFQIGFSQDKTPWLSFGGGITTLSSSTKTTALDNGYNIQADAFFPFYKKIFSENHYFLLGINVGANYTNLKNSEPDNVAVSNKYQVYSTTNTVSSANTDSSSSNIGGLLGLQATFGINKFYVSPLLSTGYSNLTLQGYSQTATYTANGQSKQKELVQREKQNLSGFMMKPQLRMGYHLSPSLSLFTNVAYTFGPKINTTTNIWVPQGGFNSSNQYEPPQIQNGSWLAKNTSSDYKTLEVNIGVTFLIGKSKGNGAASYSYAVGRLSMTQTTPKQTQGQNFSEKVASNPQSNANALGQGASLLGGAVGKVMKPGDNGLVKGIDDGGDNNTVQAKEAPRKKVKCDCGKDIYAKDEAACRRICQFLKDGTYINGIAIFTPQELQEVKDNYLDALMVEENGVKQLNPAFFRQVTNPEDLRNKRVSIKKEDRQYIYLGNEDDLVKILTIPSAFVQTCPNCNENDNCDNSIRFDCCCTNGFCWCLMCIVKDAPLTAPEEKIVTPSSDKSINEKGIKRGESAIVAPTTDKSISSKGVKRSESAIVAPTTDKSISSKGVKRSESAIVAPTTDKSISSKGVKRSESAIVAPSTDKSINEKGIKRTDTSVMVVSGQPIGGIIVKGGKNPGGNLINAVTNEKGEISFTITEVGEYTLKITTPEASGKSISSKGVKRSESAIVAPSSDKSINEKGIKRTDISVMAVSGQPIGGIIVKGGKNPGGGNAINVVTDKNGEVTFTVSETGEYTLQVLNSTNSTIKGVAPAAIKLLK